MKFILLGKNYKNYLLWLISLSIIFIGFGYYQYKNLSEAPLNINTSVNYKNISKEGYVLDVYPKKSFKSVLNRLKDDNVVSTNTQYTLYFLAKVARYDRKIKAGEYLVTPETTALQLLQKLVDGKIILHKLTIVEGLRFEQLLNSLQNNPAILNTLTKFSCSDILHAINRPVENHIQGCEGLFMPDTYLFPKNTMDLVILQKAYDTMQNRLSYLWDSSPKGVLKSSYEALIMASIIEKETSLTEEMKRVSGVYHRRLRIGIPLQADPTVIYGLKIFDRPLTRVDLKGTSDYNTYRNKGLPPSPIATPSIAAIFAALNPTTDEDHLYFVADGTGGHVFSNTLLEHNKAVWTIRNGKNNSNSDYSINR